tara:strand:- start:87 stop:353 length:267 start_codon:yes stop_codon:yes gene_type:complete
MKTRRVYAECSGALIEAVSSSYMRSDAKGAVKTDCVLARVVIDKDYSQPSKHIEEGLKVFKLFQDMYSDHEDGDVTVSLTVEDYCVNL